MAFWNRKKKRTTAKPKINASVPKPKVNSVLIKLTRHTTDVPDKYWKLYTYFVSKWVNREYRQLFTKNQFHQAMKHAKVNNLSTVTYEQVLSIFNSYLLFNGRK